MFQPKLALYALTLETGAWLGIAAGGNSDRALLLYLLAHAGSSALLALLALPMLPQRLSTPRRATALLLFATSYAVPLLGILAVIAGIWLLKRLQPTAHGDVFQALDLPELDPQQRPGVGFRQAGMRAFLANARAPVATRLRALVALQNVPGRVASPLLRDVLSDASEDIRLLAYGMLDNKERHLNEAIHRETQRFEAASPDGAEHAEAARRLSDLFWELVYQELAQGDLRTHALHRALHFTDIALAATPDDAGLFLRIGRLRQSLGDPDAAQAAYARAQALGLPKTRILPYLAELAFARNDFATVRTLMHELGDWQSLPRLQPVIRYWSQP